ncbi:MAG: Dabb family protein [Pricia sp.]
MRRLAITFLFSTLAFVGYGQAETNSRIGKNDKTTTKSMKEFDPHFAHTVFFWLKNPDSLEDRNAFETSLQKFLDNSAYAKTTFIGKPPRASRDVVDGSFTYSLIVSFESAAAQQKYQDEAPHKVFIDESEDLWEKVIVYDSEGVN